MKNVQWVTPEEMFSNWADLEPWEKIALEEEQYRKQMFRSVNLL